MERRLYRSQHNRVFLGVCGGIGEYFHVDPVIIRIVAVIIALATWIIPSLVAYFIMALVIPLEGSSAETPRDSFRENVSDVRDTTSRPGEEIRTTFESKGTGKTETPSESKPSTPPPRVAPNSGLYILGLIIIAIGIFFILVNFFGWFWSRLWPLWLIIAGLIIIVVVAARRRK